jgi:replicative DNA helicase
LVIGSLFANPDLLLDYGELIKPQYDFSDPDGTPLFLFNSIYELHKIHANTEINQTKINIYMNQDAERKRKYDAVNGYKTIEKMMAIVDLEDFPNYYDNLKKYSLLREYERKGFPAQKLYEKNNFAKLKCEDIVKAMEYQVSTIGTVIGGIQDSVILGKDMKSKVQQWKIKPDVGLPVPFEIINMLIRGLRNKKLALFGMHSGCGKSRTTSKIACYLGILLGIPVMVAANEQDEDEWNAMVLSCVINNPEFHRDDSGHYNEIGTAIRKHNLFDGIDETVIVTGAYQPDSPEEEIIMIAAEYIENRTKIHFLEMAKFDENTLRRQIKRHKLKGCRLMIYDTLKAPDHDWMSFVKTADMLKEIAKELSLPIWATFQLTDDSLFEELLTSKAIANGKHIKHVADVLMMARPMFSKEYDTFTVLNPNGFMGEERTTLNPHQTHYIVYLDKNRGGRDKSQICLQVDKGKNMWTELGYLVLSEDQKEIIRIRKEHKKLKQEKEVKKLKEVLGKE